MTTSAEPFLIAHKVRGLLAFDVAIQMTVGDEVWWILPTVGHRAYPFWTKPIKELQLCLYGLLYDGKGSFQMTMDVPAMPSDLRDFYSAHDHYRGRRLSNPTSVPRQKPTLDSVLDLL